MIKFFTAPWCTACEAMKNNVDSSDLDKVKIINIDNEPQEAVQAGIRSVPVLIKFDEAGEEIERHYGTMSGSQFKSFIA